MKVFIIIFVKIHCCCYDTLGLLSETQERRKALIPFKKHLQNKLGQEWKVFIAYPTILKYLDENGNPKNVRDEDFKKLKGEMQEEEGR